MTIFKVTTLQQCETICNDSTRYVTIFHDFLSTVRDEIMRIKRKQTTSNIIFHMSCVDALLQYFIHRLALPWDNKKASLYYLRVVLFESIKGTTFKLHAKLRSSILLVENNNTSTNYQTILVTFTNVLLFKRKIWDNRSASSSYFSMILFDRAQCADSKAKYFLRSELWLLSYDL